MAPVARRRRLPAVCVDPSRELRTVAGLRPYRTSGFRAAAENAGDKLVAHNYASRLALDASDARAIAVLDAGAVGLASARLLQRRGADVRIYTAAPVRGRRCRLAIGLRLLEHEDVRDVRAARYALGREPPAERLRADA